MIQVLHLLGWVCGRRGTQVAASPSDHAPNLHWIQDFRLLAWVFWAILFLNLEG